MRKLADAIAALVAAISSALFAVPRFVAGLFSPPPDPADAMDAEAAALRAETERLLAEADALPEPAPAPSIRKPRLGAYAHQYAETGVRGRLAVTNGQRVYTRALRESGVDLSPYSDEDLEAHVRREVVLPGLPSWACVDDRYAALDAADVFEASPAFAR